MTGSWFGDTLKRMQNWRQPYLFLAAGVLAGVGLVALGNRLCQSSAACNLILHHSPHANVLTNQHFLETIRATKINLENPREVFAFVFSQLPATVHVYPTENYYYWRLQANNQEIWGNIRLDLEDREKGIVSFAYFSAIGRPEKKEDLDTGQQYSQLGAADGVVLSKTAPLRYALAYQGKQVEFWLNDLAQTLPAGMQLAAGEELMARTFDESGFQFVLLYQRQPTGFRFVLDETAALPDTLEGRADRLWVGRLSGFAFYADDLGRKVLIGVDADNTRRNNYYDGPFDQLADNFIEGDKLQKAMEESYPYLQGRINQRGIFMTAQGQQSGERLALTPYLAYNSWEELRGFVSGCRSEKKEEAVIACLSHDYKQDTPAPS